MHASICILKAEALGTTVKMLRPFFIYFELFMRLRERKQQFLEQIHVIMRGEIPPTPTSTPPPATLVTL